MTPQPADQEALRSALIRMLWRSVEDDAECTCCWDDVCCECEASRALGLGSWQGAGWASITLPADPSVKEKP